MHGGKFGPGCLTLGDGCTLLTNSPTLSRCCHKDVKIQQKKRVGQSLVRRCYDEVPLCSGIGVCN